MVGKTAQDGKEHTRQGDAVRPTHRLSRRDLVLGAGRWTASAAGLALFSGCQFSQQRTSSSSALRRIGYLSGDSRASSEDRISAFRHRLNELGWVEGDNLAIEWRFAGGNSNLLPGLAADLLGLPVDLIVALGTADALAAKQQTDTVPIVFINVTDPLAAGLVRSLARPGANITGTTYGGATLGTKSVELFKMVLPQLARLSILGDSTFPAYAVQRNPAAQAAATLGIQTLDLDIRTTVEDVDNAFGRALAWHAEGLILLSWNGSTAVVARVAELATTSRLPAMGLDILSVQDGALMGFGPDVPATDHRGAEYADKILRGVNPADVPVEEPSQFDFAVNVKAAQALGITFSPDAAAQVTQWV
jgi:putative ABC transport system substrate-binding protein